MDSIYHLVGKRLKEAREENHRTLEQVGKRIGTHKSTIQRWENGKTEKISMAALEILADYYGVNANWLAGKTANKYDKQVRSEQSHTSTLSIPVVNVLGSNFDYLAPENIIGTIAIEKSYLDDTSNYFALKVTDDCMFPVLLENDIVIVKSQDDFETGDIVVASLNGKRTAIRKVASQPHESKKLNFVIPESSAELSYIIRKGKKTDTGILLQAINTAYDPFLFSKEEINSSITILGIVKRLERNF